MINLCGIALCWVISKPASPAKLWTAQEENFSDIWDKEAPHIEEVHVQLPELRAEALQAARLGLDTAPTSGLAVKPWAIYSASLCFHFLIWKIERLLIPTP